jgi:hypothetical protein
MEQSADLGTPMRGWRAGVARAGGRSSWPTRCGHGDKNSFGPGRRAVKRLNGPTSKQPQAPVRRANCSWAEYFDPTGAGLGGGAYNDATSSLALTKALVTLNEAEGSPGVGGGVYTLGTFTDLFTLIVGNEASTSGDDVGP